MACAKPTPHLFSLVIPHLGSDSTQWLRPPDPKSSWMPAFLSHLLLDPLASIPDLSTPHLPPHAQVPAPVTTTMSCRDFGIFLLLLFTLWSEFTQQLREFFCFILLYYLQWLLHKQYKVLTLGHGLKCPCHHSVPVSCSAHLSRDFSHTSPSLTLDMSLSCLEHCSHSHLPPALPSQPLCV